MSENISGERSVGATHDALRIINHYLILYRGNEYTKNETAKKILASIENLDGLTPSHAGQGTMPRAESLPVYSFQKVKASNE